MDLLKYIEGLEEDIQADLERESEALVGGAASDFAAYRHRVGVINGLKRALQRMQERRRTFVEDEETDV